MTLFKTWKRQKLVFNEGDPTYRVKYLGNVQTGFMKGDGCVDKPTGVLWNNYTRNGESVGLDMSLTICGSGLKAVTREQGLTEYRAHRIAYCIAHPRFPKLFIWVYRHEGKKMKVELRCHAVLCKSVNKANLMAVQLHDKLTFALSEFMREKTKKQSIRLAIERVNSKSSSSKAGMSGHTRAGMSGHTRRNKFLSTAQNFKPSVENSAGAPKLGAITEDEEGEEEEEEDGDDDSVTGSIGPGPVLMNMHPSTTSLVDEDQSGSSASSARDQDLEPAIFDLVIGNDIEQLKRDLQANPDDSDAESSESGFSEQGDNKDGASSSMTGNANCHPQLVLQNGSLGAENMTNNNSFRSASISAGTSTALPRESCNRLVHCDEVTAL